MTKAEITSGKILEAAITCVATLGIERSSVTEIANEAQVSRGLVAHYFPKKADVFEKLVIYIATKGYLFIEDKTKNLKGKDAVLAYIEANLDFFFQNPRYYKTFSLLYYFAGIDEKHRALNTQLTVKATERIYGWLTSVEKSAYDRKILAASIHDRLVRGIQRFYVVNHKQSVKAYKLEFLETIEAEMDAASQA